MQRLRYRSSRGTLVIVIIVIECRERRAAFCLFSRRRLPFARHVPIGVHNVADNVIRAAIRARGFIAAANRRP